MSWNGSRATPLGALSGTCAGTSPLLDDAPPALRSNDGERSSAGVFGTAADAAWTGPWARIARSMSMTRGLGSRRIAVYRRRPCAVAQHLLSIRVAFARVS